MFFTSCLKPIALATGSLSEMGFIPAGGAITFAAAIAVDEINFVTKPKAEIEKAMSADFFIKSRRVLNISKLYSRITEFGTAHVK